MRTKSKRRYVTLSFWLTCVLLTTQVARAQEPQSEILFINVNVFDGRSDQLSRSQSVLVSDNLIKAIGANISADDGVTVIDGGGRTLMPGLHDMHTHIAVFRPLAGDMRTDMDPFHIGAVAAARAEGMLMNGFTTIRDIGGPAKFIQRSIDAGIINGPRVFPTEAMITQTSGHGDFRNRNDRNPNQYDGPVNFVDRYYSCFADGDAEIRRCVREQLGLGATQIKIFTGGGVSSERDPLHTVQYTPHEIGVAVEAAAQWKTYVATHAFTDESIRIAVENGVKVIEHGPLMSEKSAKLLAEEGVWLVPSVEAILGIDWDAFKKVASPATYAKGRALLDGVSREMEYAVKHNVRMAFGTDLLFDWEAAVANDDNANQEFHWLAKFMPNVDVLRMATSNAAELLKLSGPNNPYKDGPTGVIERGAYADVLLVDGNPLNDISLMTDPDENFRVIMKNGVIYKNTL